MRKLIVASDFHGNEEATRVFCEYVRSFNPSEVELYLLGDFINYGPRPREVIEMLRDLIKTYVSFRIRGNHEDALYRDSDRERFSSQRGKDALDITRSLLTTSDVDWLLSATPSATVMGRGYDIYMTHGIKDDAWVAMKDSHQEDPFYDKYGLVLTGHSHKSRLSSNFHSDGRIKTVFLNPGSVGQDRSGKGGAHWALVDQHNRAVKFIRREYDVEKEIAKYDGLGFHEYYQSRLRVGS